jgi:hypothetical protein
MEDAIKLGTGVIATMSALEDVEERLQGLVPTTDAQRWLKERALQVSSDLSRTRWLLRVKSGGSIPTQFLVIVVCWLTVILGSFGLFAPRKTSPSPLPCSSAPSRSQGRSS